MLPLVFEHLMSRWPNLSEGPTLPLVALRVTLAMLAAMGLVLLWGPGEIRWLRRHCPESIKSASAAIQQLHQTKQATPTMGGLLLLICMGLAWLLFADWREPYVWIAAALTLSLGALGAYDDWIKLTTAARGLSARRKLIAQTCIAAIAAVAVHVIQSRHPGGDDLLLPLVQVRLDLGWLAIPLAMLVIVASSNAVNLTDGLDGLASGCLICAGSAMTWIAWAAGDPTWSARLALPMIEGSSEMAIVGAAMLGSLLGFLRFNRHPAAVFMGNTGSLSLGGLLGLLAVITRQEILLAVIGGVFVAEAASVILQVASYRWRKRRVFLCAPIHHHFQLLGMPEPTIVLRFWIVAALCAAGGLTLLGAGGLREADSVPQTASLQRLTR